MYRKVVFFIVAVCICMLEQILVGILSMSDISVPTYTHTYILYTYKMHAYVHTYIHAYIHTHVHTYIHK